ncbi:hypothetical protein [Clostridium grantii]|uniref:Uncharacterized protein n=1 Tax=Clostridium grantii DSM 8605 TaxID=1121316 RepID=A0A1M5WLZ2_9CLOT|nr:hypothetical protein [Clostridium grantii]SHH88063.1 hypothetical protein SAMN02745207_02963 [Clostridium grantii DSM 8605]
MEKKEKFAIVLIIILLISNMLMFKILNQVDNKMMTVQEQSGQLRQDIDSISKSVNDSVKELSDEQKWLKIESQNIMSISDDLKQATIQLKWGLRELNSGDKVYLIYGSYKENIDEINKWELVEVEQKDVLSYEETLTLETDKNYYFKVEVINKSKTIIENLTSIELTSMFKERIETQTYFKSRTDKSIEVYLNVVNDSNLRTITSKDLLINEQTKELFKIKNIKYRVYINNEIVLEKILLKEGIEEIEGVKIENNHGLEIIDYSENIELENDVNVAGTIEVIVEDYFGNIYKESFTDR